MGKIFHEFEDADILSDIVNKHKICIVDFYADWCGPCMKLTGEIEDKIKNESFSKKIGTDVFFVKINVDYYGDIGHLYKIKSIPHVVFYKNGALQPEIIKGCDYEALVKKIEELSS